MILADTSAWVEYDRATGSAADQRIVELISTDGKKGHAHEPARRACVTIDIAFQDVGDAQCKGRHEIRISWYMCK